jgi:hypothetical protein
VAKIGYKQIFESVVVVVADADTDAQQTRFFGYIRECSIAVVAIEAVAGSRRNVIKEATADNEDVDPPIIVIIKKSAAAAHDLGEVSRPCTFSVEHDLRQSRRFGHIDKVGERLGQFRLGGRGKAFDGRRRTRDNPGHRLKNPTA